MRHSTSTHMEEQILLLLLALGWAGYGLYWRIIELLAEAKGYRLPLGLLHTMLGVGKKRARRIVEDFGLFQTETMDGVEYVYSSRLIADIERQRAQAQRREQLSQARSMAGRKGGQSSSVTSEEGDDADEASGVGSKGARAVSGVGRGASSGSGVGTLEKQNASTKSVDEGEGFDKPTAEEVQAYVDAEGLQGFTGAQFVSYYESQGWHVGKNKMRNWRASCWSWHHNQYERRTHAPAEARAQGAQHYPHTTPRPAQDQLLGGCRAEDYDPDAYWASRIAQANERMDNWAGPGSEDDGQELFDHYATDPQPRAERRAMGMIAGQGQGEHTASVAELLQAERNRVQGLRFQLPEAGERLREVMSALLQIQGKRLDWLAEYGQVVSWLEDNKGKGLLLHGGSGLGKTMLTAKVIPALFREATGSGVRVFSAEQMKASLCEGSASTTPPILLARYVCIDDVGTESTAVRYGERREAFAEVVDCAERSGKLLLLSTNLSPHQLGERYGMRVLDRLMGLCRFVSFAPTHSRRG